VATPDDNAIAAALRLVRHDVELLPVVESLESRKLIGTVCPLDVFKQTALHGSGGQAEPSSVAASAPGA
jgi:CBS-domain-containing membrane protein